MDDLQEPIHLSLDYIELGAVDMAATRRFYEEAFGWHFAEYGPDYMGFKDASSDGARENGGFRRQSSVDRSSILPVLYSDDLAATFAAVKAAGGEITREIFAFPGGRRFQFLDPSGNELGVWAH
jgi:hypothetical protein